MPDDIYIDHDAISAQYQVGSDFFNQKDYVTAEKLLRPAAEKGHADSQYLLAEILKQDDQNDKEVARLLRLAADQKHPEAQCNLGRRLVEGRGVEKNKEEAVELFALAAAQGLAQAQYNLGVMLELGCGTKGDHIAALIQYDRAATQGHAQAYKFRSKLLHHPDSTVAKTHAIYLAAQQGYAPAQYAWGLMLETGYKVGKDKDAAAKQFRLAAEQGHVMAKDRLNMMGQTSPMMQMMRVQAEEDVIHYAIQRVIDIVCNNKSSEGLETLFTTLAFDTSQQTRPVETSQKRTAPGTINSHLIFASSSSSSSNDDDDELDLNREGSGSDLKRTRSI